MKSREYEFVFSEATKLFTEIWKNPQKWDEYFPPGAVDKPMDPIVISNSSLSFRLNLIHLRVKK